MRSVCRQALMLYPPANATREAIDAIGEAELILIGLGSFYTSLLPLLLLPDLAKALRRTPAPMVYIDNLGREEGPASNLTPGNRLKQLEQYVGKRIIDAVIIDASILSERQVIQAPL